VAAAVLFVLAASASAETTKINGAAVSVWFPDNWSMEKEGQMLVISDPAGDVALMFQTVPAKKLDEVLDALDEHIGSIATDVELVGQPQDTELNGMRTVLVDGKGKAEGKRVKLSVAVVERPNQKALLVFGVVESAKLKKHEKALTKILTSLKPTK
jgi:hypothetical protein